jgi:signal transducing adaptor molecule
MDTRLTTLPDKATDENLASEDWDVNLQICDKVTAEGTNG